MTDTSSTLRIVYKCYLWTHTSVSWIWFAYHLAVPIQYITIFSFWTRTNALSLESLTLVQQQHWPVQHFTMPYYNNSSKTMSKLLISVTASFSPNSIQILLKIAQRSLCEMWIHHFRKITYKKTVIVRAFCVFSFSQYGCRRCSHTSGSALITVLPKRLSEVHRHTISRTPIPDLLGGPLSENETDQLALCPRPHLKQ